MIPICILAIEDESDRDYMANLFMQYERLMYATIVKVTTDPWTVDDILQNTLIHLIDKISVLRKLEQKQLANYIVTSCRNTALNQMKYQARHSATPFEDYIVDADTDFADNPIESQVLLQEDLTALDMVWGQLDERTRYLLEARYVLDKSPEEIAKDLHIKPASTRMALTRARKKAAEMIRKASFR